MLNVMEATSSHVQHNAPEPAIPGPSGECGRRGKQRKRARPQDIPTSDESSSAESCLSSRLNRKYNVMDFTDGPDLSSSDDDILWGLGEIGEEYEFNYWGEDRRYSEFPRLCINEGDPFSAHAAKYKHGLMSGHITTIVTDSEDDFGIPNNDPYSSDGRWSYGFEEDIPVLKWIFSDKVLREQGILPPLPDPPEVEEPVQQLPPQREMVTVTTHHFEYSVSSSSDDYEASDEANNDSDDEGMQDNDDDDDKWNCTSCKSVNHPIRHRCIHCWHLDRQYSQLASMQRTNSGSSTDSGICVGSDADILPSLDDLPPPNAIAQEDLCLMCSAKPRNASLIHKKTGHQVCCYKCAKKLKRQKQPCPICRKKIEKVIKNYF